MSTQSVIFRKDLWTISQAEKWLKENGYRIIKEHTTNNYHRFRQLEPEGFKRYRNKKLGSSGIELVIGYKK